MNTADAISWLKSGHYDENMMVRLTSKQALDESPASCAVSQWPLLCANNGVLALAQFKHLDASGDVYHGLITRLTGLGSRLSGLLIGEPKSLLGSLRLVNDKSAIMIEAFDIDWSGSVIEVRTSPRGTDWADAYPIFVGVVDKMSNVINSDDVTFTVRANDYLLDEEVWFDRLNPTPYLHTWRGAATFGYVAKFPIGNESIPALTSGSTADCLVCLWPAEDGKGGIWGDTEYTSLALEHDPYLNGQTFLDITNTDAAAGKWKDDWSDDENGTYTFSRPLFASVKGYNTGGFLDHAGEIFQKAVSIANYNDGSTFPSTPALDTVTVDSTSFDDYDTSHDFKTGVIADAVKLSHKTPDYAWNANVIGENGTWRHVLNTLIGGTGGAWAFSRDNKLQAHRFLSAPTSAAVIDLTENDYDSVNISVVPTVDGAKIEHENAYPNGSKGYISRYGNTSTSNKNAYVVDLKSSIADGAQGNAYGAEIIARFGEYDLRLNNCLAAKTLSIGDAVTIIDARESVLETKRTGWITGVDRGTEPYLEIRV